MSIFSNLFAAKPVAIKYIQTKGNICLIIILLAMSLFSNLSCTKPVAIKYIQTKEELEELYDHSAFTIEGFPRSETEKCARAFLRNYCTEGVNGTCYLTTGKVMNEICHLTGMNAYREEFLIASIKNYPSSLRSGCGFRWLDDIIDNNAMQESYHPFIEDFFEEDE